LNLRCSTTTHAQKVSNQEDLPELSAELSTLRKRHDVNRGSNFFHERNLSNLQKEFENFKQEESKTRFRFEKLRKEAERLETSIQETLKKQSDALETRKVYHHIIERMKVHKLRQEINEVQVKKSAKQSDLILQEEQQVKRKQLEAKIKAKQALDVLESFVKTETRNKEKDLKMIKEDVEKKDTNNSKREERFKRQIEIAERAANEDRELEATQMREDVMLMRFYFSTMGKTLDYDMKRQAYIEEAFEKVRKNSSINDTNEMITKFLTSEIAYNDLRKIVDDVHGNIHFTQKKIDEIEKKLKKTEKMKTQIIGKDSLCKDIIEKNKLMTETHEKLMRIKGVHNKIIEWTGKILQKTDVKNPPRRLKERMQLISRTIKDINKAATLKAEKKNLQKIIASLDNKELKKIRFDSEKQLNSDLEIVRELAHRSPSPEGKQKK
jgi:hypothetical protein